MFQQLYVSLQLFVRLYQFNCMGQEEAKQRDNISDNFTIIRTISPGEYWVRRHRKTDELQLRLLTFYLQQEMQQYIRLLERRKKIKNPHLLQLVQHTRMDEQNLCSATFKVRTLVQYPFKTLAQEVQQRGGLSPRRYFSEDQMWSILYSCCHGLHSLYINKFYHQSLNGEQIFIDTSGLIKIADNILVNCTKNYLALMNEGEEQKIRYISPQLVNLVEDNNFYFYQKQKSDVFILGMLILEIGNLVPVHYYNKNTKKFDYQTTISALDQMSKRYSQKFCQILEKMLLLEFKDRPRFEDVINNIQQKTTYTGSSVKTSAIKNDEGKKSIDLIPKVEQNPSKNIDSIPNQRGWSLPPFISNTYPPTMPQPITSSNYQPTMPTQVTSSTYQPSLPVQRRGSLSGNTIAPSNASFSITKPILAFDSKNFSINSIPSAANPYQANGPYPQLNKNSIPQIYQPQPWKMNSILRELGSKNDQKYTPYQQLLNLTGKSNPNPGNPLQFNKKQPPSLQPISKPNINLVAKPFTTQVNNQPITFPKLNIPSVWPASPPKKQQPKQMESRKFSQTKFGKIELEKNIPTLQPRFNQIPPPSNQVYAEPLQQPPSAPSQTKFVIQQSEQGIYQGFKSEGMRNGIGRLIYKSGSYCEGEWRNDKMEGYGKLYYSNGSVAYEGNWHNGTCHGKGKLYNMSPCLSLTEEKPIDHTDLSTVKDRWLWYEGQLQNDERQGKGIIKFVNGEKFNGTFVKDSAEGEGTFEKMDGDTVHGRWHSNIFVQTL